MPGLNLARDSPIGQRIHVIGNSCSGKSTLGARLAGALGVPFVDLDALNWEPGWVGLNAADPEELERRMCAATASDGWVAAGSYLGFSQRAFWSRLQTVIWLDLPLPQLLWRALKRSWRRWRSKELLWGTNYETFWPQLMVWRKEESLLWWVVTQQRRKRRNMLACMTDLRWAHIHFVRLTSSAEVAAFTQASLPVQDRSVMNRRGC
jgi:adenylate kinase family enzyme